MPLADVQSNQRNIRNFILTATFFTIIITALLALLIADRSMKPVKELTKIVDRMAEGDLSARLFPSTRDEVAQLNHSF